MKFDDFDIEKIKAKEKKSKILSVRTTKKDFEWIKRNKISATRLFNYALGKLKEGERRKNE